MKKLLIILAVLVMDVRDEGRSPGTKSCSYKCKMENRGTITSVPEENIILIKLQ